MLSGTHEVQTRILLVDDHPVVRAGFRMLLSVAEPSFVFCEAESRTSALEQVLCYQPQVALLDLTLAGVVDLSLITEVRAQAPATAIIVASMHDERLYAERAIRAGAKGYLMKNHAAESIVSAVRTVLGGEIWLSGVMSKALLTRSLSPSRDSVWEKFASLSERELEVLRLLGMGLKKSEMAARLSLSIHTIETYRTNLKRKLRAATGAELYRIAFLHFQNEGLHT